nr:hypothetical protein [Rhizobium phaseoli]
MSENLISIPSGLEADNSSRDTLRRQRCFRRSKCRLRRSISSMQARSLRHAFVKEEKRFGDPLYVFVGSNGLQTDTKFIRKPRLMVEHGFANSSAVWMFRQCIQEETAGVRHFTQPVTEPNDRMENMLDPALRPAREPVEIGFVAMLQRSNHHRFAARKILVQRSQGHIGPRSQRFDALFGETHLRKLAVKITGDFFFSRCHWRKVE